MSSVPMPRDLSEEAVAEWLYYLQIESPAQWRVMARAVRALVEREVAKERASTREKVREAAGLACRSPYSNTRSIVDYVVSRVMGDHPQGGHDEGRPARDEAPRG